MDVEVRVHATQIASENAAAKAMGAKDIALHALTDTLVKMMVHALNFQLFLYNHAYI